MRLSRKVPSGANVTRASTTVASRARSDGRRSVDYSPERATVKSATSRDVLVAGNVNILFLTVTIPESINPGPVVFSTCEFRSVVGRCSARRRFTERLVAVLSLNPAVGISQRNVIALGYPWKGHAC